MAVVLTEAIAGSALAIRPALASPMVFMASPHAFRPAEAIDAASKDEFPLSFPLIGLFCACVVSADAAAFSGFSCNSIPLTFAELSRPN
ncbi:MAG: hypothetical protein H7332_15470 [Bdellovibrionales bacterium]|nr:hypothetical protein [Ramlibacter sp.]